MENMLKLFDRIINKDLLIRRVNIVSCNVVKPENFKNKPIIQQFDLFSNYEEKEELKRRELEDEKEER